MITVERNPCKDAATEIVISVLGNKDDFFWGEGVLFYCSFICREEKNSFQIRFFKKVKLQILYLHTCFINLVYIYLLQKFLNYL